MRQVLFVNEAGNEKSAWFHQFTSDGCYAILEFPDGNVTLKRIESIRFTKTPRILVKKMGVRK